MPGRVPRRQLTRGRMVLVLCFSAGVGLVPGGLAFGLVGQLLGEPQQWVAGVGVSALGVVLAAVGGVTMLVTRSKGRREEERT